MSNTFHINRLFLLIARQWISVGKIYLMAIGIVAGVIACFYGYALYEFNAATAGSYYIPQGLLDFRVLLFIFLGMFFITIISGTYFSDYGQKPKAIFETLIPASRLEKFLTAIFYTVVACLISYIAVFLLLDFAFVSYLRTRTAALSAMAADDVGYVDRSLAYFINLNIPKNAKYFYFLPFLFNAIFLLGSIAFKSFQYIKTAISLIVYIAIWSFLTVYIMKTLTEGSVSVQQHNFWEEEHRIFQVFLSAGITLAILLWGIAFLRLKEKEV
ncbi:hypothetical protein [Sphingobacterium griseoflavum]|uniref:ABC transporter permease n=1 Tax=Sphingobacterium griseoflavum TaxID=1474952 RepID=A0ABQ3HQ62_9SPHI|nr:hypothetical protein [Sphingobacterium griseoflavum]GHE23411.1 hypothetical protein GCM10017764_03790 [Sphingobacterium griseoflavum]